VSGDGVGLGAVPINKNDSNDVRFAIDAHLHHWFYGGSPNPNEVFVVLERPLLDEQMPEFVSLVRSDAFFMSDGWENYINIAGVQKQPLPNPLNNASYVHEGEIIDLNLYGKVEDYDYKYSRNNIYDVQSPSVLKRSLLLNEIFDSGTEGVASYKYVPMSSVSLPDSDVLVDSSGRSLTGGFLPRGEGLYTHNEPSVIRHRTRFTTSRRMMDGDADTFGSINFRTTMGYQPAGAGRLAIYALKFRLPDVRGMKYNNAYITMKLRIASPNSHPHTINPHILNDYPETVFRVVLRRHRLSLDVNSRVKIHTRTLESHMWELPSVPVNSLMGEKINKPYGIVNGREPGVYDAFLVEEQYAVGPGINAVVTPYHSALSGYRTFKIDSSILNDHATKDVFLLFGPYEYHVDLGGADSALNVGDVDVHVQVYEAGLLLEDIVDTSEKLLMPTFGRLFMSPTLQSEVGRWPLGQIRSPIDVILSARMQSNWSETMADDHSAEPLTWGRGRIDDMYGYKALIDFKAFNSVQLEKYDNLRVASQLLDESAANTDKVVQDVGADFYLVCKKVLPTGDGPMSGNWLDSITMPHETICCLDVPPDGELPLITYDDLITSPGAVREPSVSGIYCQPILKYRHVDGLGYTRSLEVLNITSREWRPEFTPGFGQTDGAMVWNKCKEMFNKYKNFVKMPQNLIEQKWVQDYNTAVWKIIHMLDWSQKSRISVAVPWDIGKEWGVGTFVRLSLKHIQGGDPLLCVVEGIHKKKYGNSVRLDLVYLDTIDVVIEDDYDVIFETGRAQTWFSETGVADINIIEVGGVPPTVGHTLTITAVVAVSVGPTIDSFVHSPDIVYADDTLTLSWTTAGASNVELKDVDTGDTIYSGQNVNGSVDVVLEITPEMRTRTFQLIAYGNEGGRAEKELDVTVYGVFGLVGSLAVSPDSPFARRGDAEVLVRWTVQAQQAGGTIDKVTLNDVDVDAGGELPFVISNDTEWVVRAYLAGGATRRGRMSRWTYINRGTDEVAEALEIFGLFGFVRPAVVEGPIMGVDAFAPEGVSAPLAGHIRPTYGGTALMPVTGDDAVIPLSVQVSGNIGGTNNVMGPVMEGAEAIRPDAGSIVTVSGIITGAVEHVQAPSVRDPEYPVPSIRMPLSGGISSV
jgi:hypothetical protein